jgi:hypothetical protein
MKKVRFYRYIEVVLIPNISDYENYRDLWWTEIDKQFAQQESLFEIQRLLYIHPSMKFSQARRFLYQRQTIDYRPEYFSDDNAEFVTM